MPDIFQTWPHRWFGWFDADPTRSGVIPSFSELVDDNWHPQDLHLIVQYLRESPVYEATSTNPQACFLCGDTLVDLGTWRWDNKWLWAASLAHFVASHNVRLPNEMVEDIRKTSYVPLTENECNWAEAEKVMVALAGLASRTAGI